MEVHVLSSELREFIDMLNSNSEDIRELDALTAYVCSEYHEVMENNLAYFSNYLQRGLDEITKAHMKIAKEATAALQQHMKYAAAICDDRLRGQLGDGLYGYIREMNGLVSNLHVSAADACVEFDKATAFGMGDAYEVAARWEDEFAALFTAVRECCELMYECLMRFVTVYSDIAQRNDNED